MRFVKNAAHLKASQTTTDDATCYRLSQVYSWLTGLQLKCHIGNYTASEVVATAGGITFALRVGNKFGDNSL
jgi:hypothetical protein